MTTFGERGEIKSEAESSREGILGSRVLASAHFNGPYIKTTEQEKKLYYNHQCQLVWHAAVSLTLLPIHKKTTYSHLMASQ